MFTGSISSMCLRANKMPAVLLEAGLIINRDEETLLSSPEHHRSSLRLWSPPSRVLRDAITAQAFGRKSHTICVAPPQTEPVNH